LGNEEVSSISIGIQLLSMMAPIELDHQALFIAAKVGDKSSNWILAPKFCSAELARAQARPQFAFYVGFIAA